MFAVLNDAIISLGASTPPEKSVLNASSTLRLESMTSFSVTNIKNPVVGFGVVGINTVIYFISLLYCVAPVTKPIDFVPAFGKSTRTTRLKACLPGKLTEWIICFSLCIQIYIHP